MSRAPLQSKFIGIFCSICVKRRTGGLEEGIGGERVMVGVDGASLGLAGERGRVLGLGDRFRGSSAAGDDQVVWVRKESQS